MAHDVKTQGSTDNHPLMNEKGTRMNESATLAEKLYALVSRPAWVFFENIRNYNKRNDRYLLKPHHRVPFQPIKSSELWLLWVNSIVATSRSNLNSKCHWCSLIARSPFKCHVAVLWSTARNCHLTCHRWRMLKRYDHLHRSDSLRALAMLVERQGIFYNSSTVNSRPKTRQRDHVKSALLQYLWLRVKKAHILIVEAPYQADSFTWSKYQSKKVRVRKKKSGWSLSRRSTWHS